MVVDLFGSFISSNLGRNYIHMDYASDIEKTGNAGNADIVIVDDNGDNLRILAGILRNAGYLARPVSSGKMALNAIFAKLPNLILLDIMMPDTDGFELCRQLKASDQTIDIPIIFISALDALEEKLKAFSMGGVDYITKPFQEAEVMARVETHLNLFRAREALSQSEAKNRQLKKAESLGRMAGAVAHQFNNHLQAVLGNLEMTMEYLPDTQKAAMNIAAAMKSAQNAADVSRLMLTSTGQAQGRQVVMDLSACCQSNLSLMQSDMPESIIVETDFPSPGPMIKGNAPLIRQVMGHLVANATEAMVNRSGIIWVSVRTYPHLDILDANCFPPNWHPNESPYACLEIRDQGQGVADVNMENIFDPFYSTHFTGRGLGLPVALGIVGAHGGGMTVESTVGMGSVFRVFFPVCNVIIPSRMKKIPAGSGINATPGVLLVEDEVHVRKMICEYLEQKGYRVFEASSGTEALDAFRSGKNEIRCVLTDLTMPGMDGWETLSALRNISPDIYVILTSGYDEARVMADTHAEMPQAFVRKPYNLKLLLEEVQKAFV